MNPFVNPNKRSVTLPAGCKDLIDVLNHKPKTKGDMIRQFIRVVLFQARQDNATELVIGRALPEGQTPIRYKIKQTWYEWSPFPSHIRPGVVAEIARLATPAAGQAAGDRVLDIQLGASRSQWILEMSDPDGECRLIRVPGEGEPA